MDLLQNLEVFIPVDAEVKIVPLRSLPSSVQRRMGSLPSSSWQPADSLEGVWICPAQLRWRGERPAERTGEGEEEEDVKQLVWQQSNALTGPVRMSFVTSNRAAYNVLSTGAPPRRAVLAAAAATAAAAGCAAKTHQDTIVVYRNRIYLSIRRKPRRRQGPPRRDHPSSVRLTTGHKRQAPSPSLLPRPKQPKKNLLTQANDGVGTHQESPGGSGLSAPGPVGPPMSTPDVFLRSCHNHAGPRQAADEVPGPDSAHAAPPLEAEGPRSKGDAEVPELGVVAEEGDGEGNPSSGDRPSASHCGGGLSLGGAESPFEGTSSSVSARKQQVDFKALGQEEKIARMKARLQQREAALKNLQLP